MESDYFERRPLLGHQEPRSSRIKTQFACGAVLATETLERMAFYGIAGNLVLFLNKEPFEWMSYNATNALFLFGGIVCVASLLGGWIADSILGKFKTMVISLAIYLLGYIVMPLLYPFPDIHFNVTIAPKWCSNEVINSTHINTHNSTSPWIPVTPFQPVHAYEETCSWAVYLSLCVMGLGIGAMKANIAPFGADQIRHEGPQNSRNFFNWFYWCTNVGALLSLGGIGYLQQTVSFFWGFVAPLCALVLGIFVFVSGRCVYIVKQPTGSVLTNVFRILREACIVKRKRTRRLESRYHVAIFDASHSEPHARVEEESPQLTYLDHAKVRHGGSFHDNVVDDVKALGKIFLVFLSLVPYWLVYFQMSTTYIMQGLHMKLDLHLSRNHSSHAKGRNFQIPITWLGLFNVIFVLIFIPLLNKCLFPMLDRRGMPMSVRTRIAVGMVFSFLSVLLAGGLEYVRLGIYWDNTTDNRIIQYIGNTDYRAANLTILWMLPQYALIGISEAFASVAGLEMAYSQAPKSLQGIIMGLFWLVMGLGSFLGTVVLYSFRGVWFFNWDRGDINCRSHCPAPYQNEICACHLDYYFFFLAGIQLVGMGIFIVVSRKLGIGTHPLHMREQGKYPSLDSRGSSGPSSLESYLSRGRQTTHDVIYS